MDKELKKSNELFSEIKTLIEESRRNVALAVNASMSLLYWEIGERLNMEMEQYNGSESYGQQIVASLWRQLEQEYGKSFSEKIYGG